MTLHQFVETATGTIGTRAELRDFEQEYRRAAAGDILDAPPGVWIGAFIATKRLFRLLDLRPLGCGGIRAH